ncbi:MAG: type VI secretion system baseplate subunit TssG [Pseudomonadales bacterium]|nr:type VI secretion system baseplate subunit TssG [Pseudomonadales bacterium]
MQADTLNWYAEFCAEPEKHELFAALRALEKIHSENDRLGRSISPKNEGVTLSQTPSMAFAPSAIHGFIEGDKDKKDQLSNFNFGIFGPNGPMPLHLTEYAQQRSHNFKDHTFSKFADIFHHRLLSLFYRSWADSEPTVEMDRPADNRFDLYVGALCGLGDKEQSAPHLPPQGRFYQSGLLAMQSRPADALAHILHNHFKLPFEVDSFTGGWLTLSDSEQSQLTQYNDPCQLGINTSLGEKIFDLQHIFTVRCGPTRYSQIKDLLPGQAGYKTLLSLIRCYAGDEYDWDIAFSIEADEIPGIKLGEQGQLGWSSWLGELPKGGLSQIELKNQGTVSI